MKKMKMTIGKLLIGGFTGIVIISISVVSFIAISSSHRALTKSIGGDLQHLAESTAHKIDIFMTERVDDLKVISQADVFETQDKEAISSYLAEVVKAHYGFNEISVVNMDDKIIASSIPESIGVSLSAVEPKGMDFYMQAKQATQGDVFVQDAHFAALGKDVIVTFYAPITDEQNIKVIAVLMALVNFDLVKEVVTELDEMTIGRKAAYIVNDPGEVIFTLDPETRLFRPLADIQSHPDLKTLLEGDQNGYIAYTDIKGDKVLAGYADLDEYGKNEGGDWSVISIAPAEDIFLPSSRLRNNILILGLIIIVISGSIALIITRTVLRQVGGEPTVIARITEQIANGNLDAGIEKSEKTTHGIMASVRSMTVALKENKEEVERSSWLTTGQSKLNDIMRGELDIVTLSRNIISYLCEFLSAKIGAIYMADSDATLSLCGSYAYEKRKNLSNKFSPGEGLVGQAALEKQRILVTDVPKNYIKIQSGLGDADPFSIVVKPILFEGNAIGVIELGAFHEFSDQNLEFLDLVSENIAIAINSAQSRSRMAELLEETQQQAEELQTQQEELRQANEELEEQTKSLKASEARLQEQQEELRQTNEELEEQAQNLEEQKQEVDKKNSELEQARQAIEEKAKDLEITGKYKSEFLANMSHELRTPLNSILLLSKLIADNKEGNLTEKQMEFGDTIYSSGSDLMNLINDVLDLSKVESGKMELHVEDVVLQDLARSMKHSFQQTAREKGLNLITNVGENLPDHIRTDQQRIEQVLKNFLSNAVKFTEKGEITLRIFRPDEQATLLPRGLSPKDTIAFSVSDTGVGIPEDKQKLIFEAFQQVDGTTSRKYGGTGLGLSISREIAKLIGGEILLESTEGRGSNFVLFLPEMVEEKFLDSSLPPKEKSSPTLPELPAHPVEGVKTKDVEEVPDDRKTLSPGDKSILIIEDDHNFAKILRDLAKEKGFKSLVSGDGETGLHFADYYIPSAIILDIGLPGIDGWSVMSRLKENPKTMHIPVHFISAFDNPLDALKMGAIGHITKPVSMEKLDQAFGRIDGIISKKVKKLLVVEDDATQRKAIDELIKGDDVKITTVSTGEEAYSRLKSGKFDCMILDLGLPDIPGAELLAKIRNNEELHHIPIIIYTGKELTGEEKVMIDEYAEKIIVKDAKSPERLLDETTIFLHRVEAKLPQEKQKMLRLIHDKETILKGKKILLIDDDMRNIYALTSVLEDKGIQIQIGKNGEDGLEKLSQNPDVDLIIMDIMMPGMDGYEATKKIRKENRFKNLPIIALTAKAMKGDRAKCIEAGASDYLAKPVDTDKLLSMLRVWLY